MLEFMENYAATIIIVIILALCIFFAIRRIIKNKKSGICTCAKKCSECNMDCSKTNKQQKSWWVKNSSAFLLFRQRKKRAKLSFFLSDHVKGTGLSSNGDWGLFGSSGSEVIKTSTSPKVITSISGSRYLLFSILISFQRMYVITYF